MINPRIINSDGLFFPFFIKFFRCLQVLEAFLPYSFSMNIYALRSKDFV